MWSIHFFKTACFVHRDAKIYELIYPVSNIDMAFPATYIIHIRIFFLLIRQFRVFHHFYCNVEFIPQFKWQIIIAAVTNHFKSATDLKFQQHKAALLIKLELYMGLTIAEILLLEWLKELICNFIRVLMNSGFQPHKRYLKFPAMTHGTSFFLFIPAVRMGRKGNGKILKF